MTVEIKYNFDTPSDYTFDSSVVEVTGGVARLKLDNQADQTFTEDFSSDTGFTYDNTKAEFAGGQVEQKNQRPANANFGASYTTSINGSWGNSPLVPTSTKNNPQIVGGKLDLVADKNVVYDLTGSLNANKGAIKLKFTPNYNGSPSANQQFFYMSEFGTARNRMHLDIAAGTGAISARAYNNTGGGGGSIGFGNWTDAIQGQEYEIEFNWDFTTGSEEQRLFIDGIQQSGTASRVELRDDNLTTTLEYRQGGASNSNHLIADLIIFDEVQHTGDYTPGYTVPDNEYAEASVTLPTFNYSGLGAIQLFQSIAQTAFGNGKWILNGRYHDGGNWVISDGSYAQSNSITEINSNIGSSLVSNSVIMTLVFPEGAIQSSVSNFVFTYTGQHYINGSTIKPNTHIPVTDISDFVAESVIPANTGIFYTIEINAIEHWFNNASWVPSNGTLAETNTASVVASNLDLLPIQETGDFVLPKIYFQTDGSDRSEIESLCLKVSYDVNPVDKPQTTIIYGSLIDMVADNMTGQATLRIENPDQFFIGGNSVQPDIVSNQANVEGIAAVTVIKTASIDYKYNFYIDYFDDEGNEKTKVLGKSVAPDDTASNIANLTFEAIS